MERVPIMRSFTIKEGTMYSPYYDPFDEEYTGKPSPHYKWYRALVVVAVATVFTTILILCK